MTIFNDLTEIKEHLPPNSLIRADCLEALKLLPDNSVDALITDPPYGLSNHKPAEVKKCLEGWLKGEPYTPKGKGFMSQAWDAWVPGPEVWRECLRVVKPGGHALVFTGTRSIDLMGMALRLAGWEIKDTITWCHGQGFNKNKHHLKPAHEDILLLKKPHKGSIAENVLKWGTGGLNIDKSRIATTETLKAGGSLRPMSGETRAGKALGMFQENTPNLFSQHAQGRWPANLLHDGSEEVTALFPQAKPTPPHPVRSKIAQYTGYDSITQKKGETVNYAEGPLPLSTARFFKACPPDKPRLIYCPKASKKEKGAHNNHPTVKPLSLMRYLCTLITPPHGVILDPFMGSGTTGVAAVLENFPFIGIELNEEYCQMAKARIASAEPKILKLKFSLR